MPGHCQAMIAASPQISCRGEKVPVLAVFKQSYETLCPSNPATYQFLEPMLDEVMEIFPSPVIHIGGDECPRDRWKQCPRCQRFMKERGFKSENQLQSYFTTRIADYLRCKGRRVQGWGEILAGGLHNDTIVQQWLDPSVGLAAAKGGHDVVISQHEWLYLDYPESRTSLRKILEFDPLPPNLTADEARHYLGIQAQLWTENFPTEAECDRPIWPRMLAVAEVAWSPPLPPADRNFDDFLARVQRSATIPPATK